MARMRDAKAERLTKLEPRIARQRVEELEAAIPVLRLARGTLQRLERSDASLMREIDSLTDELNFLRHQCNLPVWPRERPKLYARREGEPIPRYHVYVDECGTKDPKPQIGFPLLSMAAVIVESGYYERHLCPAAVELKKKYWPGRTVVFHEPNMRNRQSPFAFDGDIETWTSFYSTYARLVAEAEFIAVGVVIDKAELFKLYNLGGPDQYLPRDAYAIAYDYLMETVCYALYHKCDNARGTIYPESVQAKSDALLQIEHSRIYLKGTRRVPGSWFQYQLKPGLEFLTKGDAFGNELADTVARTIADHRLGQGANAPLWAEISPKLFCGDAFPEEWGNYRFYPDVNKKNASDDMHQTRRLGPSPNSIES